MLKKWMIASVLFTFPLLAVENTGVITKVIDGTTFSVMINNKEEKVKVPYIVLPEKNSGAKLEKEAKKLGVAAKDIQELGKLANDYAFKFFKKGDKVVVDVENQEQSGRMLATVSKDGIDYSTQIIEDGFACIYKKSAYPGQLEKAMKSAKEEKKGLWSIQYDVMNKVCK